jgi:uncharacterized RDD family membrane protein YckC
MSLLIGLAPLALSAMVPRHPDGNVYAVQALLVLAATGFWALLVSWWYWVRWPARHSGRTWAMRWLRMRVVRRDGRDVSAGELTVRWLLLPADLALLGMVALASILLTPDRQRVGDLFAETVVIRANR